jgi:Lectin C-type domain
VSVGLRIATLALVVAGCGASLGDPNEHTADAAIDAPVMVDAPIDSRPCMGGDAHASDGTSCFVFVRGPVDHDTAKTACEAMTAHLAFIRSSGENEMIAALILGTDAFLGATDLVTEGNFIWDDGSALTYTNWRTGEPSSGGGLYEEDCAIMEGAKTPDDTWDDRPCAPVPNVGGGMYGYVCEY